MKKYPLPGNLSAIAGLAVLASLFVLPLAADERDHDRARAALEAGEIVSLDLVLSKVENMFNGSILEVDLEEEEAEFWGGDGEKTGGNAGKGAGALPGIVPMDGPIGGPIDGPIGGPIDGSLPDSASAETVPMAGKLEPLADSVGGYADGEGAVAGRGARGATTFIYKVKLLSPQGNVLRIEFNAKSMEVLGVSGRDPESARKTR